MSPGQPRTPRPSTSRSGGSEDRGHHRLRPRRQPPCPTGSGFRTPTPPRPAPSARLCSAVGSGFGDRRAPSSVAAARWTRAPSGASANAVVATSAASTRFGQALRFAMDVPSLVGHPHGMRTRDFQIDPDQPAGMSRHQQLPSSVRGIHRTRQTATLDGSSTSLILGTCGQPRAAIGVRQSGQRGTPSIPTVARKYSETHPQVPGKSQDGVKRQVDSNTLGRNRQAAVRMAPTVGEPGAAINHGWTARRSSTPRMYPAGRGEPGPG